VEDIDTIYAFCKQLILNFERLESIDYSKVMSWVRKKIESSIDEYTVIYANEQKAGYYECKECHQTFVPTYLQVLFAPHINRTRYMKCPHCGKRAYQKKVISK
jgi:DNA-directed RNA polymerase subunit RPC12/RpoP